MMRDVHDELSRLLEKAFRKNGVPSNYKYMKIIYTV